MAEVAVHRQTATRRVQATAWVLAMVVVGTAFVAWAQVRLTGRPLSSYDLFPLFGLMAFSLMWTHYITGAVRRVLGVDKLALQRYFTITSGAVLALILLHPGIFFTALWLDGFGLPPFSYWEVYADLFQRFALLLGTLSLAAFLVFELHRKFKDASWWRYIEYLNIAAMFAIFYHALTLGGELGLDWFRVVWFMYGATLVAAVIINVVYGKRREV